MFVERLDKARGLMAEQGVDVLMLSVGADLPYFCGYEAMPLERLTMLVVPRDGAATLVVPRMEAARVVERPEVFVMRPWDETEDPTDIVAGLAGGAAVAAVGDHMWSRFLVDLMGAMPDASWRRGSDVTAPIRSVKTADGIERLRAAGAAVDRVAGRLPRGENELVGRAEGRLSGELGRPARAGGTRGTR
ncbi:MAG: aminopeptidase P family N-terminal domain-containing protein, partial [Acidimicrobiaceae bacterium]|nr:aminopeptidase P family N-terminal domain-containing protein [Acidimicrobiaceae bacterium]